MELDEKDHTYLDVLGPWVGTNIDWWALVEVCAFTGLQEAEKLVRLCGYEAKLAVWSE